MAFVMEGGLKEELWVELRKLMCVRYDGAARAGLGEAATGGRRAGRKQWET
jgi:hypothetical protein